MGNTILAKGVNHILAKRDNPAWPKGSKLSGFSNVCTNGYLKTDLDALGVFMLCIGGFMAGGGINKAISERSKKGKEQNNVGTD